MYNQRQKLPIFNGADQRMSERGQTPHNKTNFTR